MKLIGALEIRKHLGVSEATLMGMIQNGGLPAKKSKDGEWVSTTEAIDKFMGKKKAGKASETAGRSGQVR